MLILTYQVTVFLNQGTHHVEVVTIRKTIVIHLVHTGMKQMRPFFYFLYGTFMRQHGGFELLSCHNRKGILDDGQRDAAYFLIDIEGVDIGHAADIVDDGHEAGLQVRTGYVVLAAHATDELL